MPLSITTPIIMVILWSNLKKVDVLYVLIRHLHIRAVYTKTPIHFQVYKAVTKDRPTLDLTDHFTNRNVNFLKINYCQNQTQKMVRQPPIENSPQILHHEHQDQPSPVT